MGDRDRTAGLIEAFEITLAVEAPGEGERGRRRPRAAHGPDKAIGERFRGALVAFAMEVLDEPGRRVPDRCERHPTPGRAHLM